MKFRCGFALFLLCACAPLVSGRDRGEIVHGPVLSFPREDGVWVWWHVRTPGNDHRVRYGLTEELGQEALCLEETSFPFVELKGLEAGKRYHYRVVSGACESEAFSFSTLRPGGSFRMGIWADNQSGAHTFRNYTVPALRNCSPDLLLVAGDLVEKGAEADLWRFQLYEPARDLLCAIPWFPVRGNHDGESPLARSMLPIPCEGGWYAATLGPVRLVVLNSNLDFQPGSSQHRWLCGELASSEWRAAPFRIASFHKLPFASYWDSPGYDGEPNARTVLVPLFEDSGTDLIVCGHAHYYQRGERRTPNGSTHYLVVGGGGGAIDMVRIREWPHIQVEARRHHIVVMDASPQKLDLRAIDSLTGRTFDEFSISARPDRLRTSE